MKTTIMVLAVLLLTACGGLGRSWAILGGVSRQCVDGVTYLQFASGATVQRGTDGGVVPCQ